MSGLPLPQPVVVTRPPPQAQATAARLRDGGYGTVLLAPVMAALPLPTPCPVEAPPALIVITSARALPPLSAPPPPWLLPVPCHTVGPTTAEAARAAGFHTVHTAAGSADALTSALTSTLPRLDGQSLLWLTGRQRTPGVEQALCDTGAQVTLWERYDTPPMTRLPPEVVATLSHAQTASVLLLSARSARLWQGLVASHTLGRQQARWTAACLSPAIAAGLDAKAWAAIQIPQPETPDPLRSLTGC